jgi:6-phosphogluconolactonase
MRPIIQISKTQQSLYTDAAKTIADRITTAISDHGYCTLVLSGGSTPAGIYKTLAESYKTTIDWTNVHFFWGDERTVPPDHEDSNYRMAYNSHCSLKSRTRLQHLPHTGGTTSRRCRRIV